MGFSGYGLAVGLAVLAPSLLLIRLPPRPPLPAVHVPVALTWLERAGQAACLVVPAITAPGTVAAGWLIPLTIALAAYYALWVRYLLTGRPLTALYGSLWTVPVPMAILPVIVFFSAAGWLGNPWIAASAAALAAGHIPAALIVARAVAPGRGETV
ncbi:hypothetical protein [Microbacterium sp. PA5]|uniref:hypothetical protein n=1 Tax=Microbacterium sp. PA5 TaxID=3416654 RepID=UPI003CE72545